MCTHNTASRGPDEMCLMWLDHSLVLHILGRHQTSTDIHKIYIGFVQKGGTTRSREGLPDKWLHCFAFLIRLSEGGNQICIYFSEQRDDSNRIRHMFALSSSQFDFSL